MTKSFVRICKEQFSDWICGENKRPIHLLIHIVYEYGGQILKDILIYFLDDRERHFFSVLGSHKPFEKYNQDVIRPKVSKMKNLFE